MEKIIEQTEINFNFNVVKRIIEVRKDEISILNNLIKKCTKYCKTLQLPEPEFKKIGTKTYYGLSKINEIRGREIISKKVYFESITDDYNEIIIKHNNSLDKNIIKQEEVDVYEIEMVQEIKPNNDWNILGIINHVEGLIISAPNKVVPFHLIPTNLHDSHDCDHCNIHRLRNKTIFIKNNEDEIKRVGGSCIKNYLGYNYETVLNLISEIKIFSDYKLKIENWKNSDNFGDSYFTLDDITVNVNDIITYFFWYVKTNGYVSKSSADKYNENITDLFKKKYSSSTTIKDILTNIHEKLYTYNIENEVEISNYNNIIKNNYNENDIRNIKLFVETKVEDNNFLFNTLNFINSGSVKLKHINYIISVCSMYYGMKLVEDKQTKDSINSNYIGTIGEKTKLENLVITNISNYYTQYGSSNVYKMKDNDGNIYVKFGTINDKFNINKEIPNINVGSIVSFVAEIKNHDVFNNVKQTLLGRLSKI